MGVVGLVLLFVVGGGFELAAAADADDDDDAVVSVVVVIFVSSLVVVVVVVLFVVVVERVHGFFREVGFVVSSRARFVVKVSRVVWRSRLEGGITIGVQKAQTMP